MEIWLIVFAVLCSFAFEFIDTSLGGGYGTILTPVFLAINLDIFYIVPSILLSEIFTGIFGALSHHWFGNTDFNEPNRTNYKVLAMIGISGVIASFFTVFLALQLNKTIIKTYIGILVLVVGILMLRAKRYEFSWKKLGAIGLISSFNKAMSGGGFGPLVTAGQVVSGRDVKSSIATALACEVPVCIAGLFGYILLNGWFNPILSILLIIGSVPATFVGALATKKIGNEKTLRRVVGTFVVFLGIFALLKTYVF